MDYGRLDTEKTNARSEHLDQMSALEIVTLMNELDAGALAAVRCSLSEIARVAEEAAARIPAGGRLIYMGAGTSGRLGVLDASECPPTFGVPDGMVVGIIAGGDVALRTAVEGAEDSRESGRAAMESLDLRPADVVVGLSAAGGAAFVLGALEYAGSRGCATAGITCNPDTPITKACDMPIVVRTGPEVVTGSTRMKAGTAQKLILNMLSTCAMIQTGRVRENLMINVRPTNIKLVDRAVRIIRQLHPCSQEEAREALERAGNDVARALDLLEG